MQNKKMSLGAAVGICLLVLGGLVFISLNKQDTMDKAAQVEDQVAVNYTGKLENGTAFDSNVDPSFGHVEPLVFTLGAGQMIPGFEKEILGMKVGDKKILSIPPEEAYGEAGRPPVIPPNATLIFEVELLEIK